MVPNVPCGVESIDKIKAHPQEFLFLMYRVELKVAKAVERRASAF